MNYFLDCEFHENFNKPLFGRKRHFIDLISIGLVRENGESYYAVCKDFDVKAAWNSYQIRTGQGDRNNREPKEYWLRENVLKPIFENFYPDRLANVHYCPAFNLKNMKVVIEVVGKTRKEISNEILQFCSPDVKRYGKRVEYTLGKPEFYAFYGSYDWICFVTLFGRMIDLPSWMPMYFHDLKHMMDDKGLTTEWKRKNCPDPEGAHNSEIDAMWNLKLYNLIKKM